MPGEAGTQTAQDGAQGSVASPDAKADGSSTGTTNPSTAPGGGTSPAKPEDTNKANQAQQGAGGEGSNGRNGQGETQLPRPLIRSLRRKWEREWEGKKDEEIEAAKQQAAEEEARKQGDFKTLYEGLKPKHETTSTQLKAALSEINELREEVDQMIETRTEGWPQEILELDPARETDDDNWSIKARLAWVRKFTPIAQKLSAQAQEVVDQAPPGNTPPPSSAGGTSPPTDKEKEEAYQRWKASRIGSIGNV